MGGLKEQAQQYIRLGEMQLHVHMKMMVVGVSICCVFCRCSSISLPCCKV